MVFEAGAVGGQGPGSGHRVGGGALKSIATCGEEALAADLAGKVGTVSAAVLSDVGATGHGWPFKLTTMR